MSLRFIDSAAIAQLEAADYQTVLTELAARLQSLEAVEETFVTAVLEREEKFPTGLPTQIPAAIPHTDPEHVKVEGLAIATLAKPVEFKEMANSENSVSVRLVVMMLLKQAHSQIEGLQKLMEKFQDVAVIEKLLTLERDDELLEAANAWIEG